MRIREPAFAVRVIVCVLLLTSPLFAESWTIDSYSRCDHRVAKIANRGTARLEALIAANPPASPPSTPDQLKRKFEVSIPAAEWRDWGISPEGELKKRGDTFQIESHEEINGGRRTRIALYGVPYLTKNGWYIDVRREKRSDPASPKYDPVLIPISVASLRSAGTQMRGEDGKRWSSERFFKYVDTLVDPALDGKQHAKTTRRPELEGAVYGIPDQTPGNGVAIRLVSEPYEHEGRWYVDYVPIEKGYLAHRGSVEFDVDIRNAPIRRMPYETFRRHVLPVYLDDLKIDRKVLVSSTKGGTRGANGFEIATITAMHKRKVEVRLPNGEKRFVSHDELFLNNGLHSDEEHGHILDFFEAGGQGKILHAAGGLSTKSTSSTNVLPSRYVIALEKLPNEDAWHPSVFQGEARTEIEKLLKEGIPVLVEYQARDFDGAVLGTKGARYYRRRLGIGGHGGEVVMLSTDADKYTVIHEAQHVRDNQRLMPRFEAFWKEYPRSKTAREDFADFIYSIDEQRAFAAQAVAYPARERVGRLRWIREVLAGYDVVKNTAALLDRAQASDPALYAKMKAFMIEHQLHADVLPWSSVMPRHFP